MEPNEQPPTAQPNWERRLKRTFWAAHSSSFSLPLLDPTSTQATTSKPCYFTPPRSWPQLPSSSQSHWW